MAKPSDNDCDAAVAKLAELTPKPHYPKFLTQGGADAQHATDLLTAPPDKLAYVENKAILQSRDPISVGDYLERFRAQYFPDEVSLPPAAAKVAKNAYSGNLSFVTIKGDSVSHFDGVIYSPTYHVGIPFSMEWDYYEGYQFLLEPGRWILIARIDRAQSDQRSKAYLDYRDIEGRCAASFLDIPATPNVVGYELTVRHFMPGVEFMPGLGEPGFVGDKRQTATDPATKPGQVKK
jgi:hypothetical protein